MTWEKRVTGVYRHQALVAQLAGSKIRRWPMFDPGCRGHHTHVDIPRQSLRSGLVET